MQALDSEPVTQKNAQGMTLEHSISSSQVYACSVTANPDQFAFPVSNAHMSFTVGLKYKTNKTSSSIFANACQYVERWAFASK